MICGIDLGTTYSLIGHGDDIFTGLVASAVGLNTKQQVDIEEINENIVASYKIDMTTGDEGKVPIICSSIVLKRLAEMASKRIGEEVKDVVISVPAKFTSTQRQATWQAAEMAGLNPRGLLNEPTAAALCACQDYKDLIVVYDLGGGTFDVTILDARTGYYYVIATDGNGKLAGDNFDRAIANEAMKICQVPIRMRSKVNMAKLIKACRHAKEDMANTGLSQYVEVPEMQLNYTLTLDRFIEIMKQTFASTIELTKKVISMNLMEYDEPKMLFVGGSTANKYLREWVLEETGLQEFEFDYNPSYTVAHGISIYAKMVEEGREKMEIADVTDQLSIALDTGLADVIIEKNSVIPITESHMLCNDIKSRYLTVDLYQGENIVCSENTYIGTLKFDYGEEREAGDGLVDVEVTVDRDGKVTLRCTDILTSDSQSVNLIMR